MKSCRFLIWYFTMCIRVYIVKGNRIIQRALWWKAAISSSFLLPHPSSLEANSFCCVVFSVFLKLEALWTTLYTKWKQQSMKKAVSHCFLKWAWDFPPLVFLLFFLRKVYHIIHEKISLQSIRYTWVYGLSLE